MSQAELNANNREPEAAERLRPLLIADGAEQLRQARSKSERKYGKVMNEQMDRLYHIAQELKHPDPFTYADSIVGEAMDRSGLHPQQVSGVVHRVIVGERLKERDQDSIAYAKEALARGESEANVGSYLAQQFPNDPANAQNYARHILAETRLAVEQAASHNHQPLRDQSLMKTENNNSRTYSFDQYKKDWAYAARALQKGQSPEKVIGAMAAFRKDLTDAQQYAEKTVAKVQDYLKLQQELGGDLPAMELTKEIADSLDNSLKHISKVEVARRLYEDGADRDSVTKSLQQDHRVGKKEAVTIAKDAETRFFSERDLNYAIRARERGDSDDRIVPKIAEYREGKVEDPQAYARSIVEAADLVRDAERDVSIMPMMQQRMDAVQQQYGRDLHHSVLQLEHRSRTDVTLEIHERRPEKAYDSPSFQLHGP